MTVISLKLLLPIESYLSAYLLCYCLHQQNIGKALGLQFAKWFEESIQYLSTQVAHQLEVRHQGVPS